MLKGNSVIGQSGGPTSVINASLAGVLEGAKECEGISHVLGMRFGIEGFMAEELMELDKEPAEVVELLKYTPSSALGSCRHKLQVDDLPRILDVLERNEIRYVFMIGGNDTMDTICRVEAYAKEHGYEIRGVGVPKTVDNDLFGTDHTPGYPSAARYVALSVMQGGILARDMQKVDHFVIYQSIGRDAGWLAASSAAAKRAEDDAPHIILLPERAFDRDKFLSNVKGFYDKFGWVSVVCGEGVSFADGTPISAAQSKDKFENIEFGAMGGASAAMFLHRLISEEFGFRGEFQITESLPMSAADRVVQLDINEAYMCGRSAVEQACRGQSGVMITLQRQPGDKYECVTGTVSLEAAATRSKPMPVEYINKEGNFVTDAFLDYIRPLVGDLPEYVRLEGH